MRWFKAALHPRLALALVAGVVAFMPSCSNVEYWQKEKLADPAMTYHDSKALSSFDQKVFQSIEGAAGGFGASAGGGCGCN
jgi:hypothetical protein